MQGRGLESARAPRAFPELLGESECRFLDWLRVSHVILEEQEV